MVVVWHSYIETTGAIGSCECRHQEWEHAHHHHHHHIDQEEARGVKLSLRRGINYTDDDIYKRRRMKGSVLACLKINSICVHG
jgi:fatty-acid desaturase